MKALLVTRTALKDMKGIPQADRDAMMAKFRSYCAGELQDVEVIKGSKNTKFRLRHGDWRAIFEQTETNVTILAVGHRREIYR